MVDHERNLCCSRRDILRAGMGVLAWPISSGLASFGNPLEAASISQPVPNWLTLHAPLLMPPRCTPNWNYLSNSILLPEPTDRRIVACAIGADHQVYFTASETIEGEQHFRPWTRLPELTDGTVVRCTALRDFHGAVRVFAVRQDGFLQFSLWMLSEQDGTFENSVWTRVTNEHDDAQPFHFFRVLRDDRRRRITVFACRSPGGEIFVSRSLNAQGTWEDWQVEIEDQRGISSVTMALGPGDELVVAASATQDGETIAWKNVNRESRVWEPFVSWNPPVHRGRRLQFGRLKMLWDGVRGYALFGLGRDPMDEKRRNLLSCWFSFDGNEHPQSIERLPWLRAFRLASLRNRMALVAVTSEGPYLTLQPSVHGRFRPWLPLRMDELVRGVMDLQQFLPSIELPDQRISYAELTGMDTFAIQREPAMRLDPSEVPAQMFHEATQLSEATAAAERRRVEAIATGLAALASLQHPTSPMIKSTAAVAALLTAAAESEFVAQGSSLGLTSESIYPGFEFEPLELGYDAV